MKAQTTYEWDIETVNPETENIEDHHHSERIHTKPLDENETLVLVRDTDNRRDCRRSWAYVENGQLDTHFRDAYGEPVCKVPARFQAEFRKSIHCAR